MSDDTPARRLAQALRECHQHAHYMRYALTALAPHLPLTGAQLRALDAEAVQDLDQFVLRFGKLQDAIGQRLLPAVLAYLQEPYERRPMLDKLHRLEQLGYLDDAADWQRLRAIRNQSAASSPPATTWAATASATAPRCAACSRSGPTSATTRH